MILHKGAVTSHKGDSRLVKALCAGSQALRLVPDLQDSYNHLKQSFSLHSALSVYSGQFNHQVVLGEIGV